MSGRTTAVIRHRQAPIRSHWKLACNTAKSALYAGDSELVMSFHLTCDTPLI